MKTCPRCESTHPNAAARCTICGTALGPAAEPSTRQEEEAPAGVEPKPPELVDLSRLPGAFDLGEGFSRPDWNRISDHVAATVSPIDLDQAWGEVAVQWFQRLQTELGGEYRLRQSKNFLLLSELDDRRSGNMLRICEHALEVITKPLARTG